MLKQLFLQGIKLQSSVEGGVHHGAHQGTITSYDRVNLGDEYTKYKCVEQEKQLWQYLDMYLNHTHGTSDKF